MKKQITANDIKLVLIYEYRKQLNEVQKSIVKIKAKINKCDQNNNTKGYEILTNSLKEMVRIEEYKANRINELSK